MASNPATKQPSTTEESPTILSPIEFTSTTSSEESLDDILLKQVISGAPVEPDVQD